MDPKINRWKVRLQARLICGKSKPFVLYYLVSQILIMQGSPMRPSMILHFTKTAAISALILATTPAMALIHGELSVGQRSGKFEQS